MAERPFAESLSIAARLPWWAAALSAAAAYALLHLLARLPMPAPDGGGSLAAEAVLGLVRATATIAQYLVPLGLLVLAALAALAELQRRGAPGGERMPPFLGRDDGNTDEDAQWRRGDAPAVPAADAETIAAAEALAALIRAEDRGGTPRAATFATVRAPSAAAAPPAGRLTFPPRPPRRRAGPRRILDRIGMAGALVLAIAIWHWFVSLPAIPAGGSPLSALGGPAASAASARPDAGRRTAAAAIERPLGEFRFGPQAAPPAPAAAESAPAAATEPAPSLLPPPDRQTLEAAFDAAYIPPPECSGWHADVDIVRCGNHRMRSLRAFIESGGRMPEAPRSGPAAPTHGAPGDWRREQALREAAEPVPGSPVIPAEDDQPIGWGGPPEPGTGRLPPAERPVVRREVPPLTWRQEQALREGAARQRAAQGLRVTPQDAAPGGTDEVGGWLRVPPQPPAESAGDWRRP